MTKFERDLLPSRHPQTPLAPVDAIAAKMLSSKKNEGVIEEDIYKNLDPDAITMADRLCGAGLIKMFTRLEAARQISPILEKRRQLLHVEDPQLIEIKRIELEQRQQNINIERERLKIHKFKEETKAARASLEADKQFRFLREFKDAAERLLERGDYVACLDLALDAVK